MPPPRPAEFHRRLPLLTLGLDTARHGHARLRHQLRQLLLILGGVEAAVERRTPDAAAQPLLQGWRTLTY
jgi:hypothetical protein